MGGKGLGFVLELGSEGDLVFDHLVSLRGPFASETYSGLERKKGSPDDYSRLCRTDFYLPGSEPVASWSA